MNGVDYNRHYARFHQFSSEYYSLMARSYQKFFQGVLPLDRKAKILDIGCGTGFALHALKEAGYVNIAGIDADQGQVRIAQEHCLPVEHIASDKTAKFLAGCPDKFELVLLMDVLEHIPKHQTIDFLQHIQSALAPGRRLFCQVPNALGVLSSYNRYIDWTHECSFTAPSLSFVLEEAGFIVESIRPGHRAPSPPRGILSSYTILAMRWLLQCITNTCWRVFVIANLGLSKGLTDPVTTDMFAVAVKPDSDSQRC